MMGEAIGVVAYGLLLPLLAAGAVSAAASRMGGGGRACGAAAAVVVGFAVGNHFRQAAEYRIDSERPPARYWLPWAGLLAAGVGTVARTRPVPAVVGHLMRALAAVLVARFLAPGSAWLASALVVVVLAEWELLDRFGGEAGGWLPLGLGVAFLAAGAVLLHAHSSRLTDLATILGGSTLGVALTAWWAGADARGAVPIAAVSLPGLMLVGQQSTVSDVPATAFALAALAPLALALLPLVPRRFRRERVGVGLLLAVAGAAVFLAAWAEPLSFE